MQYLFAFHILGIVGWIGGLLILSLLLRKLAQPESTPDVVTSLARKIWFIFVVGGLVLTLVTGIAQLSMGGAAQYMQQGWFHGKLTMVLVMLLLTGILGVEVAKVTAGRGAGTRRLLFVHVLGAISFLAILLLTYVGRIHM